jgi:hypothetical protein
MTHKIEKINIKGYKKPCSCQIKNVSLWVEHKTKDGIKELDIKEAKKLA